MTLAQHHFIERRSGRVVPEQLFGDRIVSFLYNDMRESAPAMFRLFTSSQMSSLLASVNYDLPFVRLFTSQRQFLQSCGIRLDECLDAASVLDTPRKVFERKIRYWECRPMPEDPLAIVSPADARVIIGSFQIDSRIEVKNKFFAYEELLGQERADLHAAFQGGDFAVFRLTPDKYHYNHLPVAGVVREIYDIDGTFHSCNPTAIVAAVTPYSKNRRVVTIIDTDVPNGTGIGKVAMIEVVALMIGEIVQCYSDRAYDQPQPLLPGMFVHKGSPKSLYRPGSSTDILVFQAGRVTFDADLLENLKRVDVKSRFTSGFRMPLVETDVQVRSQIGRRSKP